MPSQPPGSRGKEHKVRVTEKLEAFGRNILRHVKKLPKAIVDKLVQGVFSEKDKIIKKPLELKGSLVSLYKSTGEREVNWVFYDRAGFSRRRVTIPLSAGSGKDGFVVDYLLTGDAHNISLLPTIVAAALRRQMDAISSKIKPEDLRFKKKVAYSKLAIVIVLDTSLSMQYLIGELSRALLDFKMAAWRRRDKVGLIVCSGGEAKVLFSPTNNLNTIKRNLVRIRFGGSTPLADGMLKAVKLLNIEKIRDPETLPLVLIISDGLANEPLKYDIPTEIYEVCPIVGAADVIYAAYRYRRARIPTIVINPIHEPDEAMFYGWNPTKIMEYVARVTNGIYIGLKEGKERGQAEKIFKLIFSAVNSIIRDQARRR